MRGNGEVSKNPPVAANASRLLPYKQRAPVSPLECAVTESCATAHSKRLTQHANSFRMRSYTKTRGKAPYPVRLLPPPLTRKATRRASGSSEVRSIFPNLASLFMAAYASAVHFTSHQSPAASHQP